MLRTFVNWVYQAWRQRRELRRYLKGRIWCLTWHSPVIRGLGGYGGLDQLGRRRKAYHSMRCLMCDNHWEQEDKGEPCKAADMWYDKSCERKLPKPAIARNG